MQNSNATNTQNQLQNGLHKQIEQINFQGNEEQEQHYLTIKYNQQKIQHNNKQPSQNILAKREKNKAL